VLGLARRTAIYQSEELKQMPLKLDGHAVRVERLVSTQTPVLDAFLQFRCREETDLDFYKLKHSCGGYIKWCALAVEAAAANLAKRKWNGLESIVEQMAADGLKNALETPVEGKKRTPALLSWAFFQNDYLERVNNPESPLMDADLKRAMQTGIALLGETEAQSIDASVRTAATMGALVLISDVSSAGEGSLKVAPEKLATLQAVISGGRDISSYEQRLAGNWVYQEFHSSGRSELHMVLLDDGHCVRTSKTVASLTFHDSAGNWAGFMDSVSGLDPGDRGKWRFDGRLLTLEMDDDSAYEYTVTLSGTSMMTRNTTGGAQRLWTKDR